MIPSDERTVDYWSWQDKHPILFGIIVATITIIFIPYFIGMGIFLLCLYIYEMCKESKTLKWTLIGILILAFLVLACLLLMN